MIDALKLNDKTAAVRFRFGILINLEKIKGKMKTGGEIWTRR